MATNEEVITNLGSQDSEIRKTAIRKISKVIIKLLIQKEGIYCPSIRRGLIKE